ncbi:LysR family transcriptional regulator [Aliikangiella coralliicola]|uniref:LysR family transcriptional regulator n=1 Tax=Aliikangiella coralliicola TaxID=2592383 RepID=A0A545UFC4_9GAMM|nr:LysR family transcriptional regulator [Aliikangiella coralliicola]TQV88169.1 LysR family transcriptional regulator [Aliikangiella coralliicola]
MNKLNAMATFVQIVDSGSLTGAAEVLDTSLPTVVRTLASLEEHLNTRLLNRTTRKFTLTEEGRGYLTRCRNILFEIDNAELELSAKHRRPSGKLSVTASVMFGSMRVAPLINRFLQQNSQININLNLSDTNVNLIEEAVDVAIRIGPLSDSSMIAKNVGHVRRSVCASPKLLNTVGAITHPKDLQNFPCIRFSGLSHGAHWQFHDKEKTMSIAVNGPLACNQIQVSLDAVLNGMGFGLFLSYQVEQQIKSGELQVVLAEYEPPLLPVSVVYSHAKLMSARVRVFVDWITHELRKDLSYGIDS